MVICTIWVYSYTQELEASSTPGLGWDALQELMRMWMRVRFMVLPFLVPLWLMLVASLSGREKWITRWTVGAVFAFPTLIALLATTPGALMLFRRDFTFTEHSPGLLEFENTALGYAYMVYVVTGILLGLGILAGVLWRNGVRRDLVLLMVSTVIPVTHFVIIMHTSARGVTIVASILLLPVAVAMILASVRYNLCDMAPFVARRKFFDGALEGVIILDTNGVVLEYNQAAEDGFQLVGLPGRLAPGFRLGPGLIPEPWDAVFAQDGETKMVFQCAEKEGDGTR